MADKKPKKVVRKPANARVRGRGPQKKKAPQAVGLRNALAKAFPTFSKALAVKPVEGQQGNVKAKKIKPVIPMTPTVNLLPAEYTVVRAISNIRRATAIAGSGIASALAIIFVAQGLVIDIASNSRIAVEAQVAEANLRVNNFQETSELYSVLNVRKSISEALEENRPQYFSALTELYTTLPAGTQITAVEMSHISFAINGELEGEPTGVLCGPVADPFASETRPVSACIRFSGTAQNRADLSIIATTLAASPYFSNVVISQGTSSAGSNTIVFEGTAAILKDIDPGSIVQGNTPPPNSTPTFETAPIPNGVSVPSGIIYDPNQNKYFTANRQFEYLLESGNYLDLETGNIFRVTPDGAIDFDFGPINTNTGGN